MHSIVITRRPLSTLCEIRAGTTAQASISDGFSLHGAMILHDLYARGLVQPLLAHEKSSALSRRVCEVVSHAVTPFRVPATSSQPTVACLRRRRGR